jgi:hypothetical protein
MLAFRFLMLVVLSLIIMTSACTSTQSAAAVKTLPCVLRSMCDIASVYSNTCSSGSSDAP